MISYDHCVHLISNPPYGDVSPPNFYIFSYFISDLDNYKKESHADKSRTLLFRNCSLTWEDGGHVHECGGEGDDRHLVEVGSYQGHSQPDHTGIVKYTVFITNCCLIIIMTWVK